MVMMVIIIIIIIIINLMCTELFIFKNNEQFSCVPLSRIAEPPGLKERLK